MNPPTREEEQMSTTQTQPWASPRGDGGLVGREAEQQSLDALLCGARNGRGAALVLRGEPGIGKTTLLAHAAQGASDMTLLCCEGIEAESDLPFAALHQLVRPYADLIDLLPA